MRYVATLQRFDDAHVDVAESDDRAEVVAAATALYAALAPTILAQGIEHIKRAAKDPEDEETRRKAQDTLTWDWRVSEGLRAREWGIAVYKDKELVYWIGATLEKPEIER